MTINLTYIKSKRYFLILFVKLKIISTISNVQSVTFSKSLSKKKNLITRTRCAMYPPFFKIFLTLFFTFYLRFLLNFCWENKICSIVNFKCKRLEIYLKKEKTINQLLILNLPIYKKKKKKRSNWRRYIERHEVPLIAFDLLAYVVRLSSE